MVNWLVEFRCYLRILGGLRWTALLLDAPVRTIPESLG
jgi:hypothetical protein